MTIQQDYGLRPHVNKEFTATGVVGPDTVVANMTGNLRVVVENVGGGNVVLVKGKLDGQAAYSTLATITGASSGTTVDISVVDLVQFECTTYAASGGTPKLVASGFFKKATSGGGSGEVNTASNVGAGGQGLFDAKVGVDLQFRNINAASSKITVALDNPNKEIDIDVDPSAIDVADLDQVGALNNDTFVGTDSAGALESVPGFTKTSEGGINASLVSEPNGASGAFTQHQLTASIEPLANSPDETYGVLGLFASTDPSSSGFDIGTNGQAIRVLNNYINHVGTSDTGSMAYISNAADIGNGTDPITVEGFAWMLGFGSFNANVTVDGPIQGYGFQPGFNAAALTGSSSYVNGFYDFANMPIAVGPYSSFTAGPTIGSIKNNANYSGINLNPSITTFTGNAGFFGMSISGTLGTFGTGGFYGINVNPTVTSVVNATGLYINMSNVTGTNVKAIDVVGDVAINGALSFTGALSIGQLNAFYAANVVDGGGNPTSLHGLVTQVTAPAASTTANCDTLGVNTAMLIQMDANSTMTSGALGLGLCALALPCVVETHTGSTLDYMSGAAYAVNLAGTSTGGTIEEINLCKSLAIPNGITTVDRLRGYHYSEPFGGVGTVRHGFYAEAAVDNYFAGSLVIGGTPISDDVVTNSSVALEIKSTTTAFLNARMTTTQKNALTAVAGLMVFDTTLNQLSYYDGSVWVNV